RFVGVRVERSEERRGTRQVALGLRDTRLYREGIHVVGDDIKKLVKLSQPFGKTTKSDVGNRVLGEQVHVAWVETLGFVEIRLALVPLASRPRDIGQRVRNAAAIGQKLSRLLKVTHRRVVIFQTTVVIIAFGPYGLPEIGLKSERGFGGLPCLFTEGDRWLKNQLDVGARFHV